MKRFLLFIVVITLFLWSCSTVQPPLSFSIMAPGSSLEKELAGFLKFNNPEITGAKARRMAVYYIKESAAEGVNHDIAFAQMCIETGFLTFRGSIASDQNNFCGLGAVDSTAAGASFSTEQLGVRAHIQHLKAYGSTLELNNAVIDPRFKYVKRGRAELIYQLAGTWAQDPDYGNKLERMLERLYRFRKGSLEGAAFSP